MGKKRKHSKDFSQSTSVDTLVTKANLDRRVVPKRTSPADSTGKTQNTSSPSGSKRRNTVDSQSDDFTETNEHKNAQLLKNLMLFVDNTRCSKKDQNEVLLKESLDFLDDHLRQEHSDFSRARKKVDVAQLVLPWLLKQLMYYQQQQVQGNGNLQDNSKVVFERVHWQLTESSIKVLVENQSKEILSSILPQGMLNKIVPPLVLVAMKNEGEVASDGLSSFTPARVYHMLVSIPPASSSNREPLFRPTLQLALHNVLKPMIEIELSRQESSEGGRIMLSVTLEWILKSILSRGNPKTCFQLLATKEMLVSLSRLYSYLKGQTDFKDDEISVLQCLISEGILSAEHHLIEFMPLLKEQAKDRPRSKKKGPYQQDFMNIFQSHFVSNNNVADEEALLNLLAVLLEQFIVEMNQLRKQTGSSAHPYSAFHMFRHLSQFALERRRDIPHAAWKAIRDMTGLLITHNIYIPSQDDANQSQFRFLAEITSSLLACFAEDALPGSGLFVETIVTMQNLLELNHDLLHEDLVSAIVASCLKQYDEDLSLLQARNQFWMKMMDTYRKLRQQSHLIKCMLNAIPRNDTISFGILDQPDVASAFAVAMEASPIAEVQTIFHSLETWFVDPVVSDESLQKATEIAVLMFRTTCVTKESVADTVSSLVKEFSQNVIISLIERNSTCALKLCAWLINLQGQCAFWLGREHQFIIPEEVQKKLSDDAYIGNSNATDEAPLLLMSHRLEQLVSIIHDHEISALHNEEKIKDNDQVVISRLQVEGKRLASLMSRCMDNQISAVGQSARSGWLYIAQCVHVWAVFAEERDSDHFIYKVLSAIALSQNTSATSMEEKNVALTLMGEVAFLDLFVDRIPFVAYAQLASLFVEQSNDSATKSPLSRKMLSALNAVAEFKSCVLGIEEILDTFVQQSFDSKNFTFSEGKLQGILTILQYINSLPSTSFSRETFLGYLTSSLFLEHCCVSTVQGADKPGLMLKILVSMRQALSQILASQNILEIFREKPTSARSILDYILDSTREILQHREIGDHFVCDFLSSTSDLLSVLVEIVLVPNSAEVSEKALHQILAKLTKADRASRIFLLMTSRAILRGVCKAQMQSNQEERADTYPGLRQTWNSSWSICKLSLGSHVKSSQPNLHKRLSFQLLGGLLTLANTVGLEDTEGIVDEAELVLRNQSNEVTTEPETKRSQIYLHACLAKVRPTLSSCKFVLAELSSSSIQSSHSLLEASFCQILESLDPRDTEEMLQTLVEHGLQHHNHKSITLRFKLLTLLLECAQESSTVQTLSLHAKGILTTAIQQTVSKTLVNRNSIVIASNKMLRALIRRKDILVLGDQDLHHILTAINQVVGEGISSGQAKVFDCDCFIECCKTLLLLLQRCIKQLYPSVHLVISLLYSLMESILQITEDQAENLFLEKRCNEFTRLCELLSPHKDVYKKHVVGLVLFFVNHLVKEKDHSLTVKNALLPAVHCLLDTFSEYETSQLNALMSTQAKSAFRSIYQSYRKFHAYKGG